MKPIKRSLITAVLAVVIFTAALTAGWLTADAGAPRDRFERTVAAAELCLGAGRADVALGLLETADAAIQAHQL